MGNFSHKTKKLFRSEKMRRSHLKEWRFQFFNSVGKNAGFFAQLACLSDKMKFLTRSEKMRGPRFDCAYCTIFSRNHAPFVQYDKMKKVYK